MFKQIKISFTIKIIILLAALLLTILLSFTLGRYSLSAGESLRILFSKLLPLEQTWSDTQYSVVWDVRFPRIIVAVMVGAGLAVAGSCFQGVFKNHLVSPDILGVSAAAGFGAALGIILSDTSSYALVSLLAFAFSFLGVFATYLLAKTKGGNSPVMLVLSGIVITSLANAGISIMKYLADPLDQLPAITFWLMGSLSSMRWANAYFSTPIILVCTLILIFLGWKINLLTMGDAEAKSLGVNVSSLRRLIIIMATIISATCVSMCGTIGWVGLVIPHISRFISGPDHRKLIPVSFLSGAIFLLIVDNITRSISESAIPLSIITALVGAPFFAFLIKLKGGQQ